MSFNFVKLCSTVILRAWTAPWVGLDHFTMQPNEVEKESASATNTQPPQAMPIAEDAAHTETEEKASESVEQVQEEAPSLAFQLYTLLVDSEPNRDLLPGQVKHLLEEGADNSYHDQVSHHDNSPAHEA